MLRSNGWESCLFIMHVHGLPLFLPQELYLSKTLPPIYFVYTTHPPDFLYIPLDFLVSIYWKSFIYMYLFWIYAACTWIWRTHAMHIDCVYNSTQEDCWHIPASLCNYIAERFKSRRSVALKRTLTCIEPYLTSYIYI